MTVNEKAKDCGYDYAKFLGIWKGYKVFDCDFKENAGAVGVPTVFLVKGKTMRIAEENEVTEIYKMFYPEEND